MCGQDTAMQSKRCLSYSSSLTTPPHSDDQVDGESELFLTLSVAAITGQRSPKSMCLLGSIQGKQIRILVDSVSSRTFISSVLAAQLSGVSAVKSPMRSW